MAAGTAGLATSVRGLPPGGQRGGGASSARHPLAMDGRRRPKEGLGANLCPQPGDRHRPQRRIHMLGADLVQAVASFGPVKAMCGCCHFTEGAAVPLPSLRATCVGSAARSIHCPGTPSALLVLNSHLHPISWRSGRVDISPGLVQTSGPLSWKPDDQTHPTAC